MDFVSRTRIKMLALMAITCVHFGSFHSACAQPAAKAFFNSTSNVTVNTVLNLLSPTGTWLSFRTCEAGEILTQTGSNRDTFSLSVTTSGLVQAAWTAGTVSKSVEVGTSSYATNEWVLLKLQYTVGSIVLSLDAESLVSEMLASATLNSELLRIDLTGPGGGVILGRGFMGCMEQVMGLMLDNATDYYNVDWGVCPMEMQRGCQPPVRNPCYTHPCKNQGICSSNAQAPNGYSCQCTARYDGNNCETDTGPLCTGMNPVYRLDCQNGGVCLEDGIGNSTYCQCTSQFEGPLCEQNVTVACDPNLCENNGTCTITDNGLECSCKPGFSGDTCAINIDECAVHQCLNRGQCVDGINSYTCNCTGTGYTGDRCSQAVNECDAGPCVNSVTCVDLSGGFVCICLPGWTGKTCETDIDECLLTPCRNGGTCMNLNNAYACQCAQGFNGTDCNVNIDDCMSVTCPVTFECVDGVDSYTCECPPGKVNSSGTCQDFDECLQNPCVNGDCQNLDNDYRCDCYPGYNGTNCEIDIDECAPDPCQMNSTCIDGIDSFNCTCLPGYGGDLCDIDIDECLLGLCENGATCQDQINSFTCSCAPGFEGDRCQNNTDDCEIQPCQNGATCVDEVNDFTCVCIDGFGDKNCSTNINECDPNPCQNNATCVDRINDYFCNCSVYYLGENCEIPYDACVQETPCQNGATCSTPPLPSREYTCECVPGFNGTDCEINVDDCMGVDCNVTSGRVCYDGVQSYSCACPIGYMDPLCSVEINECEPDPCKNNATCHDNIGNFTCTCIPGFNGERCEINIDDCSPTPCLNRAYCEDKINDYQCYCIPGFSGDNCEYFINECDSDPCDNGGTCQDQLNAFECTCVPGFTDEKCQTNIDECASDPCENNSTCTDGINEFTCECAPGFNGTLCEVDIDECASSPCNLGSCIDAVNNFTCNCSDTGFFGPQCEFNIDDCESSPCTNDATCLDLIKDYNCSCWEGYTGKDCSVDVNECLNSPCVNGSCLERSNQSLYNGNNPLLPGMFSYANASGFVCQCIAGYEGELCQINIDECTSGPCDNNGTCVDGLNGYSCNCAGGWEGEECEIEIDECLAGPCQNEASCTDLINDYICTCTEQYGGKNCSVLLTGCADNECQNGATCLPSYNESNNSHSYSCQCAAGFIGTRCTTDTSVAFENESYLRDPSTTGQITLDYSMGIATTLPDGILLYSPANTEYFLLEMFSGDLYLTYSDGTSLLKIDDFGKTINDGEYHTIKVVVTSTDITLSVTVPQTLRARRSATCEDGVCRQTVSIPPGMNIIFGTMFIGGVNNDLLGDLARYSRSGKFFTGCCRDIKNNDQYYQLPWNPTGAARVARAAPAGSACSRVPQCQPDPCNANGVCNDLWNTFTCDCNIGYTNTTCNVEFIAATFRYEDTPESYAEFTVDDALSNSYSTIRLAFRTREPNGLIFFAQNAANTSYITIELVGGELEVAVGRGGASASIRLGTGLSDGTYHYVSVTADQFSLNVDIDLNSAKSDTINTTIAPGNADFSQFSVGGAADFTNIPTGAITSNTYFKGCIWGVNYNNYSLQFDPLNLDSFPIPSFPLTTNVSVLINNCESDDTCAGEPCENGGTCVVTWNDFRCDCPTGFGGKNCSELTICAADPCPMGAECRDIPNGHDCVVAGTFNGNTSLVTYTANISASTALDSITLRARSRNDAGIIFFSYNEDLGHFVNLYLDQGKPTVRFSLGEPGEIQSMSAINDGQWHEIKVTFSATKIEIKVDEMVPRSKTYNLLASLASVITETGSSPVHLGGSTIANNEYFINYNHFKGCLDDVRVGEFLLPFFTRETINSTSEEQFEASIGDVRPGCYGDPVCDTDPCGSFGTCDDLWNAADCKCVPGYAGNNCELNIDECALYSTCVIGSTCRDDVNNYTCLCRPGYEGRSCNIETNECDPNQCLQGSQCYDGLSFFNCTCLDGYTGTLCDVLINETCAGDPCKNGATCVDMPGEEIRFECQCPVGFEDSDCGHEIDYCLANDCTNGATCESLRDTQTYRCSCPDGFSGNLCQTNDDDCVGRSCNNRGTCMDGINSYLCNCTKGYSGDDCENDINECDPDPCQFGSTCKDMIGDFTCTCAPGFNGRLCSFDIDECQNSIEPLCENGGTCRNSLGDYTCLCPSGTWGPTCQVAPCHLFPCQNNGSCLPHPTGAYTCLCPVGYKGTNCSLVSCFNVCEHGGSCRLVDGGWECDCPEFVTGSRCQYKGPCAPDIAPCVNGGTCQQEFQDGGRFTYMCTCPIGFNGTNCELEIDWCDSSPCQQAGSNCTSSRETFTCRCAPGYTGTFCETKLPDCASNLCQNGATCQDLDYDYNCNCPGGYEGKNCQTDIDECAVQPCQNGGNCTDSVDAFVCNCNGTGYEGFNCTNDINECLTLTMPCANDGSCSNTPGSYGCDCKDGWIHHDCSLANPCVMEQPCKNDARCDYLIGANGLQVTYTCTCVGDYDGTLCEKFVGTVTNWALIGGVSGGVFVLLLIIIVLAIVTVNVKNRRATQGTYSPSRQEITSSRVEMDNILKLPPEERLI